MTAREIPGLDVALERDIYPHSFSTTSREVGGVLVGTIQRGSPPLIQGSIRAIQADETAAQLTFTQDSWEHIHRVLEQDHPSAQIVGWYHTHPGYGLFLSEQDLFIHRNFFQGRSQIALVVDPIAREEAVYAWVGREIKEYFRRRTRDQGAAPPPARDQESSPGEAGPRAMRGRTEPIPASIVADATRPDPLSASAGGPNLILPRIRVTGDSPPPTTLIYLAVIGLSAGTVFWELVLK